MTCISKTTQTDSIGESPDESYNQESNLVDFILGITFEIWEQRQVEKIHDYYAEDVEVYSLEGMINNAATMVKDTHTTLASYPDRLLLADDVITTGTLMQGFSSHRLISPMTNRGASGFGPATGKQILAMNIADCEVNNGLITREWLVRDNLAVTRQLGFDPIKSARIIANKFDDRQIAWLTSEFSRTSNKQKSAPSTDNQTEDLHTFANDVLNNCWLTGESEALKTFYAPYCVLQRAPLQKYSGREEILKHYANWRHAFPNASISIDHVCQQPFDQNNQRIAVRWSCAAVHEGEFANTPASGKPIYILGVTHWQLVDGRIAAEWTVFDELAMLAQTLI
jgi:steroid delta-isomerase-like uncharacterized protein